MHVEPMGHDAVAMQDAAGLDAAIGLKHMVVVDCNATLTQVVLPWDIERDLFLSLRVFTRDVAANRIAVRLNRFDIKWECNKLLSTPEFEP